ncbi:DNA polymerase III subunit gamma and tau [Rhodococcus erythropolis]|uniref:DNA polymerase III subunit gamma and tau n=1 Tax=Rhodococcus erythropolis TaxID=1833 RepID=UPI002949B5CB|nr:DNA polymerase III subunit gamma and tau [Rhodococcus erythropolis]MDV6274421.1 DNA polymerase III subunit gamma and tau [Rhodococcus erythropolis]
MALYRKYRPASFAEVVGQEHVTAPLSTALDTGRINHAYLFSGPRGCGKTSSARILARSLNCEQGPTSTPCNVCDSCVSLGPGGTGNLDVTELDAASHGGVDDTRELRDKAFHAPAASRYRVFIIDEAHMVTAAGFNALLKIVEEPPEHLIFIFATTEPEKVLPTIRSRTHHYPFRLLAPSTMRGLLEKICAQEGVPVEPAVYPLVIKAGGGSPRDSLSVLDQLLAGAGEEGVTYPRALSLLGVTDVALIDEAVDALSASDGAALFGTVDRVMDAGHDPRRFALDLLERLRDLILMQAVSDASERGLVDAPEAELVTMREQIQRVGPATLTRFAETVHAGLSEMRGATAPRLLLEVMCARMLLPSASDTESAVLQRLERLEQGIPAVGVSPAPAARAAVASAPTVPPLEPEIASKFQRPSQRKTEPEGHPEPAAPAPAAAPPVVEAPVVEPPVAAAPVVEPPAVEIVESVVAEPPVAEPPVAEPPVAEPPVVEAPVVEAPVVELSAPAPVEAEELIGLSEPEPDYEPEYEEPAAAEVAPVSVGPTVETLRESWNTLRNKVGERNKVLPAMLSAATVHDVRGHVVVIAHGSPVLGARVTQPHNAAVICEVLAEMFGGTWQVEYQEGAPPAPAGSSTPRAAEAPTRPAAAPRFSRPSQERAAQQPKAPQPQRGDSDDIPPPEAPDYPEDPGPAPAPEVDYEAAPPPATREDEDEMFAAAAEPADPTARRDPEDVAKELLKDVLGARRLES